jgi:hypothetical protein
MRRKDQLVPKLYNPHHRPFRFRVQHPLPRSLFNFSFRNPSSLFPWLARQHPRIPVYVVSDQNTLSRSCHSTLPHHRPLPPWLRIFLLSTYRQRLQSRTHGSRHGLPHAYPRFHLRLHSPRRRPRKFHRQTTRRRIRLVQSLPHKPLSTARSLQR